MEACRENFINQCVNAGKLLPIEGDNEWLRLEKTMNEFKHLFKYEDEYGREKYYSLETFEYPPNFYHRCESFGFHSDEEGNPLCKNGDPYNYGDVVNSSKTLSRDVLHYRTYFDLREKCHYFWDDSDNSDDSDEDGDMAPGPPM